MTYTPLHDNHDKLRKVFARLDDKDESGRLVAFNVATAALQKAGLTWSDLLEAHLSPKALKSDNLRPVGNSAFGDIFEGIFAESFAARPAPEFKPRAWGTPPSDGRAPSGGKRFVPGKEAPEHLCGTIRETDRRTTRTGGPMLVIQLETATHSYGPFAMFDEADIQLFETGRDQTWSGWVRQPRDELGRHLPTFSGLRN